MPHFIMHGDSLAKKMPRRSSPASFERFTVYSRTVLQFVVLLAVSSRLVLSFESDSPIHPLSASPQAHELLLLNNNNNYFRRDLQAQGDNFDCVPSGTYSRNVDYFPVKVTTGFGSDFAVSYHNSYKVITNLHTLTTYVVYICGTPNPDTDPTLKATLPSLPNAKFIQLDKGMNYGTNSQTFFSLFKLLGNDVSKRLDFYPFEAVMPACFDQVVVKNCSFSYTCVSDEWKAQADPVDLLFVDSYGGSFITAPPGLANKELVVLAQELSVSVIGEASWLKYVSLFFNQEPKALANSKSLEDQVVCFISLGLNGDRTAALNKYNAVFNRAFISYTDNSTSRQLFDELSDEELAKINPVVLQHLTGTYSLKPGFVSSRETLAKRQSLRKSEAAAAGKENVLFLTAYDKKGPTGTGYYVGLCESYYCDFAEGTGANIDIIDADDLGISSTFFYFISQQDLLQVLADKGIIIDTVILLYYAVLLDPDGPNRNYPGPEQGSDSFFTDFLKELSARKGSEVRGFYLPDTDAWFAFRPGLPQVVFNDFMNIFNREKNAARNRDVMYFFQPFDQDLPEPPTSFNLAITNHFTNCLFEAERLCVDVVATNAPTTVAPTPSGSAARDLSAACVLLSLLTARFAAALAFY